MKKINPKSAMFKNRIWPIKDRSTIENNEIAKPKRINDVIIKVSKCNMEIMKKNSQNKMKYVSIFHMNGLLISQIKWNFLFTKCGSVKKVFAAIPLSQIGLFSFSYPADKSIIEFDSRKAFSMFSEYKKMSILKKLSNEYILFVPKKGRKNNTFWK